MIDSPGSADGLTSVRGSCPGDLQAVLVVPAEHAILVGHFPGAPLVPGVLFLDAVARVAAIVCGRPHTMVAVDDVRFHAPLLPGAAATLAATAATAGEGIEVVGEWTGAAGRLCSFRLRLGSAPA